MIGRHKTCQDSTRHDRIDKDRDYRTENKDKETRQDTKMKLYLWRMIYYDVSCVPLCRVIFVCAWLVLRCVLLLSLLLSSFVLSYVVLRCACLVMCRLLLSCPFLCCLVLSCVVLCCFCVVVSCSVMSRVVLFSSLVLSYPIPSSVFFASTLCHADIVFFLFLLSTYELIVNLALILPLTLTLTDFSSLSVAELVKDLPEGVSFCLHPPTQSCLPCLFCVGPLSYLVLSCIVLSCLALPCLVLFCLFCDCDCLCLGLPYLVLPCLEL
jgi:hypothetical protein